MTGTQPNPDGVRDIEREREELIRLMEQSIDPALLEQVTQVYGGGDTAVTADKDLVAAEGTHYAGPR